MNADDTDGDSNLVDQRALVNAEALTEASVLDTIQSVICVICVICGPSHLRNLRLDRAR
jgi:hypothetical protein